jgi:hypothetical protein
VPLAADAPPFPVPVLEPAPEPLELLGPVEPLEPLEPLEPCEPPVAFEEEHPASDRTMETKRGVISHADAP